MFLQYYNILDDNNYEIIFKNTILNELNKLKNINDMKYKLIILSNKEMMYISNKLNINKDTLISKLRLSKWCYFRVQKKIFFTNYVIILL